MSGRMFTLALLAFGLAARAGADEDTTARLRELLHRTQEALRTAQAQNDELSRAKLDAEQKLKDATQQVDAAKSSSKAVAASLQSKLSAAQGDAADLNRKLGEASERQAATSAKLGETQKELAARTAELAQTRDGLEKMTAADTSCEAKNLKLYEYGQELLKAYRRKGVWAALAQKDPVLGLKEVEIENVVQEYQVKLDSQKVTVKP